MIENLLSAQLFDRFIDCEFQIAGKPVDTIKTSQTGMKPAIKMSWNRVPGQFTYKCRLEITNWFTNTAWYDYDSVTITVGYMYQKARTNKFQCQIFNAYKPSAGPDTAAIFECIVASAEAPLLNNVAYNLKYYDVGATVKDVLDACAKQLGLQLVANASMSGLLTKPFSTDIIEEAFDSGYQVVNYLQTRLNDIVKKNKETVNVVIFDSYLVVLHFSSDNTINPSQDDLKKLNVSALNSTEIPIIDQATDITWTSGTLSITAPWNPTVTPGKLFYCKPAFYTGTTALPNVVARAGAHKDPTNCYYVVTQKVNFSTTGSTNEMQILAVRMSTSPAVSLLEAKSLATKLDSEKEDELNAYLKKIGEEYASKFTDKEIKIGVKDKEIVEAAWKDSWLPASYQSIKLNTTDTLVSLATKWFKNKIKCKLSGKAWSFEGYYLGYALIPLATYHYYLQTRLDKYYINPNAPSDLICDSYHYAIIPNISDYTSLNNNSLLSNMLEKLAAECDSKGMKQWYQNLMNIAKCIKEGTLK